MSKKIVGLIPCLLKEYNRNRIRKIIQDNISKLNLDRYIILSQCFTEEDNAFFEKLDSVELVGNYSYARGFVNCKNDLFHYFYSSDYDYSLLLDANCTISKTTLNSHLTLLHALRNSIIELDLVTVSIGILPDTDRAELNKAADYFQFLTLLNANQKKYLRNQNEMYFTYFKNISKYHMKEIFIPDSCDCHIGLFEDVYFVSLMKRCFDCWYAPSIIASKVGGVEFSTWQNNQASRYNYPKIDYEALEPLLQTAEQEIKEEFVSFKCKQDFLKIKRVEDYKECLREFRPKKKIDTNNIQKLDLF